MRSGGGITLSVLRFKENQGHGKAREQGLEACKNEIVALMDSDDICVLNRFEQQISFFMKDGADVVGGNIAEFIDDQENIIAFRTVPTKDAEIKRYMKNRCPFNQMSVMLRKSSVMKAGGYLDWYCDEDYYLWLRMMIKEAKFVNTGTVLVNVRVGKEMYQRRGGLNYFKSEKKLQEYMLKHRIIRFPTFAVNVGKRFIVQVLLPNKVRGWVFQKLAREKKSGS